MPDKTKAHTVYKVDGVRVPSVTTVLSILAKPALIDWAWNLGMKGIDYRAVRDQAGDIGTLAHYLIMCRLKGEKADTSEYSPQDIDKAENCLIKYWNWEKEHPGLEPILVEYPLVSTKYGYGGTIDCLARWGDRLHLVDHKTGKGIWPEMFCQLAAYRQLLEENGYAVESCRILRIGRDDSEGFEEGMMYEPDVAFQKFYHCLQIYKLDHPH